MQMFGNELFRTWPSILLGAGCFGALYGMVLLMSDRLMFGFEGVSAAAVGIALLSFIGYVGVALLIRDEDTR